MVSHKISTIVYSQGFLDGFIEAEAAPIELSEDWSDETTQDAKDQNEYREQVRAMWLVLSEGLDQLRKENTSLENKLALIDMARNTVT
jgi:hypothetical protein